MMKSIGGNARSALLGLLTLLPPLALALGAALPARADVVCFPQASGVTGVISNQTDVIAAVNCLGQQLAKLRGDAVVADRTEAQRIEELARQIVALETAVATLSRRVAAIEANLANVEQPLARQPW
jgi:hypothetical protein